MTISFTALAQRKDSRHTLGMEHAQRELESALSDENQYNVVDHKSAIVKDRLTAVHIAESIYSGSMERTASLNRGHTQFIS